jgi:hypothetical protein
VPFFDRPIERPEELFDKEEFEGLRRALTTRTITVVGFRRVGKTSLVKAATYGLPRIYVDARRFRSPWASSTWLLGTSSRQGCRVSRGLQAPRSSPRAGKVLPTTLVKSQVGLYSNSIDDNLVILRVG